MSLSSFPPHRPALGPGVCSAAWLPVSLGRTSSSSCRARAVARMPVSLSTLLCKIRCPSFGVCRVFPVIRFRMFREGGVAYPQATCSSASYWCRKFQSPGKVVADFSTAELLFVSRETNKPAVGRNPSHQTSVSLPARPQV